MSIFSCLVDCARFDLLDECVDGRRPSGHDGTRGGRGAAGDNSDLEDEYYYDDEADAIGVVVNPLASPACSGSSAPCRPLDNRVSATVLLGTNVWFARRWRG